jgi:hypothetical protein
VIHIANLILVARKLTQPVKGELQHWGLAPLGGEAQAMYLWFYWESFGRGYRACPMGNAQLQQLLGWSRNKVKRVLRRLIEYGHPIMENGIVSALEQFPPFEYVRPHKPRHDLRYTRVHVSRPYSPGREDLTGWGVREPSIRI